GHGRARVLGGDGRACRRVGRGAGPAVRGAGGHGQNRGRALGRELPAVPRRRRRPRRLEAAARTRRARARLLVVAARRGLLARHGRHGRRERRLPRRAVGGAGMTRRAELNRETKETTVAVTLDVDGSGATSVATAIPFFDHMLEQLGKHAGFDLTIAAQGDLEVDLHHTVEDVGIVLGNALRDALGDKRGVRRFANALVPLDEALVQVALDLSGRPFLVYDVDPISEWIGTFDPQLAAEFWKG